MKAFVILNPVAGRTKATDVRQAIDRHLNRDGWQVDIYQTKAGEPVCEVVRDRVEEGVDLVIAAGGDGTLSDVVDGLAGSGVPLGILPTGTTNVVAQELRIPPNLDRACQLLTGEHMFRAIDAIQLNDRYFVLSVGIGLDARAMENTRQEHKRRFGKLAYLWVIFKLVFGIQPQTFTIIADGQLRRVKAADILLTNVSVLTRPFRWGPHIAPDDGQIDIVIMRARNPLDVIGVIYDIMVPGRPRRNRNLRYWSAQNHIQVFPDRPLPAQGDGDLLGVKKSVEVQIWPGIVKVIVPTNSATSRRLNLSFPGRRS